MGDNFTFYAIKKDSVDDLPKGVRKFVDDFFEEREIFGDKYLVAVGGTYKSPWNDARSKDYEEGLTQEEKDDCGVFSWLSEHPEVVFEYVWG